MSGRITVFWGERILAVSAMNLTPQNAITSASVAAGIAPPAVDTIDGTEAVFTRKDGSPYVPPEGA